MWAAASNRFFSFAGFKTFAENKLKFLYATKTALYIICFLHLKWSENRAAVNSLRSKQKAIKERIKLVEKRISE